MQIIFLVVFASMDAVRIKKNLNKKTDAIGCTFNITNVRMVINIYMTCVRNDDALLTSYLAGVRAGFEPTNFCFGVGHPTD